MQDGWNITGDTFVRDADGYFWYQARSDDMIISSGYNIAGPEVEEALLGHPDVRRVRRWSARPTRPRHAREGRTSCCATASRPTPAKVAELQDFVKAAIAPYKYPRVIEFVAELPKTISGKLQRYRLRQMAGEKLAGPFGVNIATGRDPQARPGRSRAVGIRPKDAGARF